MPPRSFARWTSTTVALAMLAMPAGAAAAKDMDPPVFPDVPDVLVEATGPDGAVGAYDVPVAVDTVDANPVVQCQPPSGGRFPIGTTTITCVASDDARNEDEVRFGLVVRDTTPPLLAPLPEMTIEATSPDGAVAAWTTPIATDAVSGDLPATCLRRSGSRFKLGTHVVTCTAVDAANQGASRSFHVHVVDTTAPTISVPSRLTIAAGSASGTRLDLAGIVAVEDAVDAAPVLSCSPATGSTVPLGETLVSCAASDQRGNVGAAQFVVTVRDMTPPTFGILADVTAEGTGRAGAPVALPPVSATDDVDGAVLASCVPGSGSTFAIGRTVVTCTAVDDAGNDATATYVVSVVDTTPPAIDVPDSVAAASGEPVTWPASAADLVDGPRPIDCDARQGSTFPAGVTIVTCTSADSRGNVESASVRVVVPDTSSLPAAPGEAEGRPFDRVAPRLVGVPRRLAVDATRANRGLLQLRMHAVDAVDGRLPVRCSPRAGRWLPIGIHRVTCTATDSQGNVARASFPVQVRYVWLGLADGSRSRLLRAGATHRVSFWLSGLHGDAVLSRARTVPVRCGARPSIGRTEQLAARARYSRTERAWSLQVPSRTSWAGSCRRLDMTLRDGTTRSVTIRFTA